MSVATGSALDRAVELGAKRLLELQRPGGWWVGELESNVTMTAQHLLFHEFMRTRTEDLTWGCVSELLARQRPDGLWSIYHGGEPDLPATLESYAALRMVGFSMDDPRLVPAKRFCEERGGIGAARQFTRMWLALFGVWPWREVAQLPPELVFLPPGGPVSLYHFACWARQTIGALSIVMHYRPVRPLRPGRAIHELNLGPPARGATLSDRVWDLGNRSLSWYMGQRFQPGRERALAVMERWVLDRQELDGCWGGIQPPWVWSLVALVLRGHGRDSPYLRRGLEGWKRFMVADGDRVRPEACQSPIWDTALALLGLYEAGLTLDVPGVSQACDWLVTEEVRARGDWAIRIPGLEPGGWAFEYDNDIYPDVDDAAVVALALSELGAGLGPIERARRWIAGMQCSNGGWAAFDRDNDSYWLYELPFCDFGAVIDPPSVDVTAHVVELLARDAAFAYSVGRGVEYLMRHQEPDGSWFGRWGVNYVYGTGGVLPALAAAGIPSGHPSVRRAVGWLEAHQNEDGGFGEDCRSYDTGDERGVWRGRGVSTPSQSAWALMGLVAAGEARSAAAERAAGWLLENQREDGDWDEEYFTGTGFPRDFMIRYHLYRIVWPMIALGRFKKALR
jgi:squalene-hopene/tetraprenyl-beta-curcumene cyclase